MSAADEPRDACIDGMSVLAGNVHGRAHPHVQEAMRLELGRDAGASPGLARSLADRLAARLVALAPPGLTHVQFACSGPAALSAALDIARRRWTARDADGVDGMHADWIGLRGSGGLDAPRLQAEPGDADHVAWLLEEHGAQVCAIVVEPLVGTTGGFAVHPPGYLQALRELCDQHGALLVCDETVTGLGPTGRMFACDHEEVVPDLLCLGSGLTNGHLPLGAVLATEHGALEHAARAGDPLACAAALASLEVFERDRTLELLEAKIALLECSLRELVRPLPAVGAIRRCGFMCGIELRGYPPAARMGDQVTAAARRMGAIVRAQDDVVVLMPALAIADGELRRLIEVTARAIAAATATPLQTAA